MLSHLKNGEYFLGGNIDDFCQYFNVHIKRTFYLHGHYEFVIVISTPSNNVMKEVHKRYTQFEELDKKLKSLEFKHGMVDFKLRMPEFPEKYYLNVEEEALEERKVKLEQYLRRITNDRILIRRFRDSSDVILGFFGLTEHDVNG